METAPTPHIAHKVEVDDNTFGNREYKRIWEEHFGSIDKKIFEGRCTNCHGAYEVTKTPKIMYVLQEDGNILWWHDKTIDCVTNKIKTHDYFGRDITKHTHKDETPHKA